MSRRARVLTARAARTWLGAAGGSIAVHVIALVALIRGDAADVAPGPWQLAPPSPADSIDVVSLDDPAVRQPPPATAPEIPSPGHDAPEADQARWAALAVAPRVADGRTPAPPAPDSGQRAGRVSDGVWRRDRSTLHEQLTDGANAYQIARTRSDDHAASPQAIRREPVVGLGDASRTTTPSTPPSAPRPDPAQESSSGDVGRAASGDPEAAQAAELGDPPRRLEAPQAVRGVGPLEVESGARSFDTQSPGPAADQRNQRAASSENHPSVTDLSRAGVRAREESLSGRGPGDAPGAVERPSGGRAPAEYGGASAQTVGDQVAERTRERIQDQYVREIERRVHSLCVFPKRLALRLEQGETVVRFVVDADGHLQGGVRVSKSSGFDEFDAEATRAVERAAPFPPLPRALAVRQMPVGLRVAFDNPVIR